MTVSSTNQVDNSTLLNALGSKTSSATSNSLADAQSTFLKLLTTQLQNQDPTNPLDNAQMTSQLAQMSTAQGISDLNTTLNSLLSQYQSSQTLQATALIGHSVLASGNQLALSNAQAVGGIDLASAADSVKLQITDSAGNVVRTLDMGPQSAGQVGFSWDGTNNNGQAVADGSYSFTVSATSQGAAVKSTPLAVATVSSVSLNGNAVTINTANAGQLDLSQVYRIF
jgi:flagellar basal-body rod modification protein FlgD